MKLIKRPKINSKGFGHHIVLPIIVIAIIALVGVRVIIASHAASSSSTVSVSVTAPKANATVSGSQVAIDTDINSKPKSAHPTITDHAIGPSGNKITIGRAKISDGSYQSSWNTTQVANGNYQLYSVYKWRKNTIASPEITVTVANTTSGFTPMSPPFYSGSTWAASDDTFDDHFQNLNNWNYGTTGESTSCYPWFGSGTAPDYGSSANPSYSLDYDMPGNVSQTSSGANSSLLSSYTPQTFSSTGSGVTFTAHYTGTQTYPTSEGNQNYTWTSGAINTCGKEEFPSSGKTQVYVQIKAQMMGYQDSDNGAWNALWFLGHGSNREIDLQETGISGSQSPNWVSSHLQTPQLDLEDYLSPYDLSAGYHIYGMELLNNNTINIYFDNKLIGTASNSDTVGPYFLIMEGKISSGGIVGKPPTNNVNMNMNIAEVQIYQR